MTIDAVGRVLPVLLLVALGAALRRRGWLAPSTVADLRRFVLTVTLPPALFLTFLRVSLERATCRSSWLSFSVGLPSG